MRFRTFHHAPASGKINVTPLIDVVMVLIVFYLIVGKLAADRKAPVQLPASAVGQGEEGGDDRRPIVITLASSSAAARIELDGSRVADAAALRPLLEKLEASKRVVQVRADKGLSYGVVAPVLEACRGAGVASVKLATQRAEKGGA